MQSNEFYINPSSFALEWSFQPIRKLFQWVGGHETVCSVTTSVHTFLKHFNVSKMRVNETFFIKSNVTLHFEVQDGNEWTIFE